MPRRSAATFDIESAKAIARAVTELRRSKPARTRTRTRRRAWASGPTELFFRLESAMSIGANRWQYSGWTQRYNPDTGMWETYESNDGGFFATDILNLLELHNAITGVQGNGIDVANLAGSGFAFRPLSDGQPTLLARRIEPYWYVSMSNAIDGACPNP